MKEDKKMSTYLIIPKNKDLNILKAKGFNSFILPLNTYSIGFNVYFNVEEINELSNKENIYIMINRFIHKDDLINIEKVLKAIEIERIKGIFIEDLGLLSFIPKEKVIIYQNHMINNYNSINYFNKLGFNNIVINNELTISEIKDIRKNTNSNLYYFLVSKNILLYSKRKLVSNYFKNYDLKQDKNSYKIKEIISKKELVVSEEEKESTIVNNDIFCGNKYIEELEKLDYLIINLSNIDDSDIEIILDNYKNNNLYNLINCDYYFLENDIKYKVGDLK